MRWLLQDSDGCFLDESDEKTLFVGEGKWFDSEGEADEYLRCSLNDFGYDVVRVDLKDVIAECAIRIVGLTEEIKRLELIRSIAQKGIV